MWQGPPKALDCPKPISSNKTTTTLGAPFGALSSKRGGGLALRAARSVIVGGWGGGIGKTARLICCGGSGSGSKLNILASTNTTGELFVAISDFMMAVPSSFLFSLTIFRCFGYLTVL